MNTKTKESRECCKRHSGEGMSRGEPCKLADTWLKLPDPKDGFYLKSLKQLL